MAFQPQSNSIQWKLHLRSTPAQAYAMFATQAGRERFWAEAAAERDGAIDFRFPGGQAWRGEIVTRTPPHHFAVRYYGNSLTTIALVDDGAGGTDLTLTDVDVPEADRVEVIAGWVSVLMALKAAVDFGVDLRNHDPARTWEQGYAEN